MIRNIKREQQTRMEFDRTKQLLADGHTTSEIASMLRLPISKVCSYVKVIKQTETYK